MRLLYKYIGLCLLLISIASCSNNDADDNLTNDNVGNYFPLSLNNYWNYNVTNTNVNLSQTQNSRDSLYVSTANSNAFGLAVNGIATGTMNSILTQMELTRTSNTLTGSGNITFPFEGIQDIQIGVNDVVFYDLNASEDATLSSVTGILEQNIENLPITAEYTLETTQGATNENLFLNSVNYGNVVESSLVIELTITTQIEVIPGSFINVLILDTQDVLKITNHYAKDIGLVGSETDISYSLEDFSQIGITLPIEGNLNANSLQALDTYFVADE